MEYLWVRRDCGGKSHKQALVAHKTHCSGDESKSGDLNGRWNEDKKWKMTVYFFLLVPEITVQLDLTVVLVQPKSF